MRMDGISQKKTTVIAVVTLLLVVAAYYYSLLPTGALKLIDEYWTLDRVGSFVQTGDWLTVHSENKVNFNKPPLQYWISAYFLKSGFDLEYALRIPSFIFSLGLLLAASFLAFQLCPQPIVFPVTILILASSFRYWESALSALLDMGAAFFLTFSLIAVFEAMRRPKWWYVVALSTGLSAIQKAPIALGGVIISLVVMLIWGAKYKLQSHRDIFLNRHFALSVCLLLLLLLAWPALQILQHGAAFLQKAYSEQMWDRFAGADGVAGNSGTGWLRGLGLFRGQPLLEVPFILSVLFLPVVIKRAESYVLAALLLIYVLLGTIAGENGSPRYILMLYPAMAAALSAIITKYLDWKSLPVAVAYSLILGTPLKSAEKIGLGESRQMDYVDFLSNVKKSIRDNESLIRCRWNRGKRPIFPGTISFYASNGRPVFGLGRPKNLHAMKITPPYRGICTSDEFNDLVPWLDEPAQVEVFGNYVHWTAKGAVLPKN
jgi:4-amino-4-deoxy-L-arabinose transferase-like glycosyltransferase